MGGNIHLRPLVKTSAEDDASVVRHVRCAWCPNGMLQQNNGQNRGGRPVQILDPNRVRKLLGVWKGGGRGGGWHKASVSEGGGGRWVGRSAAGVPRGGSVGTPTYIPQHDPHDALIILNIHKWGKNFSEKICPLAQAPISQGQTRRSGQGSKKFLCFSRLFEFSAKF